MLFVWEIVVLLFTQNIGIKSIKAFNVMQSQMEWFISFETQDTVFCL